MELSSDLLEFIQLLNQNKVEYLVVGGWAVGLHGKPRYTKDIDILLNSTEENAARMMRVVEEFGFSELDISEGDFLRPGFIIQLGVAPNRIDLITSLAGIQFDHAYQRRCEVSYLSLKISLISIDDLIRNKELAGRDQDKVDVKALRRLKSN